MNKKEFLKILELSLSLKGFTEEERRDILYDYEEHFRIGEESSKTDEELIAELGDPETIADQYSKEKAEDRERADKGRSFENYSFSNKDFNNNSSNGTLDTVIASFDFGKLSGSIFITIALIFFNLIFVLGPYLGIAGALIGLFAAAIGVFAGGIGLLIGGAFMPVLPNFLSVPHISPFALVFFGIGMIAFGILFFIGDCFLGKYFYLGTVKYIHWNIRTIRK